MGRIVRVVTGQWEKRANGEWRFLNDTVGTEQFILARTNDLVDTLDSLVRTEFNIPPENAMVLTYKLPACMLLPETGHSQPTNIATNHDVEVMMGVHEWTNELTLCVVHGALNVAKYQFICRSPFKIGERLFLGVGVTEEQHKAEMLGK